MDPKNPYGEALTALSEQLVGSLEQAKENFRLDFNAWILAVSQASTLEKNRAKAQELLTNAMKPFKGKPL